MLDDVFKKLLDLGLVIKNAIILIPGTLFLIYLILFIKFNKIFDFQDSVGIFKDNNFIISFVFLILVFLFGSIIYISATRIFNCMFEKIFGWDDMNKTEEPSHHYWRHFFLGVSLTFFIISVIEIFLFYNFSNLLPLMIFLLLFLITFYINFILHNDLRIPKSSRNISKDWNLDFVRKNYYSYAGMKFILEEQNKEINKIKKAK